MSFNQDIKRNYWLKRREISISVFFYLSEVKYLIAIVYILSCIGINSSFSKDFEIAIDSLKTRLEKDLHDTDRVKTLNGLAWTLRNINPDTSIILSSEALY